jgi:eukaryotic-like serine/threonine-protein kinase
MSNLSGDLEDTLAAPGSGVEPAGSFDDTMGPDRTVDGPRRPKAHLARGDFVGRYVVVSKLGAGGMGIVYAAYDPELDRKIALKLLRGTAVEDADARDRLLREAQALARLSHPEVVAVHDVGAHEDGVYISMELVVGETLSGWAAQKRRTWREVLTVMLGVGRGIAAAHAAGLVHRDLKPDNVMIGLDGRVRVMDFGLTRLQPDASCAKTTLQEDIGGRGRLASPLTQASSLMGTPAYMAPEQFAGSEVTAAADQFAYCLTMWEMLYGEPFFAGESLPTRAAAVIEGRRRPVPRGRRVPRWLRRACERGLATDPERRWPSMEALLTELSRGQARGRRRSILLGVGGLALLALGAEGARRVDRANRVTACERAGAEIEQVWNDEARASIRQRLVATEVPVAKATADKVMPWLDAHADEWRVNRTEVCLAASLEERLDAEDHDKAVWCLEDRRLSFEGLVELLSDPSPALVQEAVLLAAGLSPPATCADAGALATMLPVPPPDLRPRLNEIRRGLDRIESLFVEGAYEDAVQMARAVASDAEAAAQPMFGTRARLLEGRLLVALGRYEEGESLVHEAYVDAASAGAWGVAVTAATSMMGIVGYHQARPKEGHIWASHAKVALAHAYDPIGRRETMRLGELANLHVIAGEYTQARDAYERALSLAEATMGPEYPDVAVLINGVAGTEYMLGDYEKARVLHERALALRAKVLGAEHPHTAASLNNLANVHFSTGAYEEARRTYEQALRIRERVLGPEHPETATTLNNLGIVFRAMGDLDAARRSQEGALAIREQVLGPTHATVADSLDGLARTLHAGGEREGARTYLERAIAIREAALGADHPLLAETIEVQASMFYEVRDFERAATLYERALEIYERALGPEHRNVAGCLADLAAIDYELGEYPRAQARYERALQILEGALGPEHDDLAVPLVGLARLASDQGRFEQAVALAERAVRVSEAAVAPDRIAASRFALARILWDAPGGDRTRALEMARTAEAGFRNAPGTAEAMAEVAAWLAARGGRSGER